jgi:hypothetical protein
VWDHVHTALSPQGDELSPRVGWGICMPVLPEALTVPMCVAELEACLDRGTKGMQVFVEGYRLGYNLFSND